MRVSVRGQPVPALADRDGTGRVVLHSGPDAHGRGHGEEHAVAAVLQGKADLLGRPLGDDASAVHDDDAAGQREGVLQAVLRQQDRRPELPVDLPHRGEELPGRDRVELARRFVQNEQLRLHHHDGGEVEKLLLAAGELGHVIVVPLLDAEEGRHLRDAAADGGRVEAERFQAEGQLVPDLVRHDLVFRVLLHIADRDRLRELVEPVQRLPVKEDAAAAPPVRGHSGLELPQQRGLAAAGRAAEYDEIAPAQGERDVAKRRPLLLRVDECQVFGFQQCFAHVSLHAFRGAMWASRPTIRILSESYGAAVSRR